MKRNVTFALLLIIAVFTLVSCAPSYKSLGKGFDSLTADSLDEAIDNFNYVIDSLPSSSKKKSLAYEGRGWAYYLKGMNNKAEADFLKAGDSIEAKTGLSLVYLCTKNPNASLDTGIFILDEQYEDEQNEIVDYLPDPLTKQEFLKTLALSSLLINSNQYSDIINEIDDAIFIDRIEAVKDGE
jgi:hypothetical protein